ncbi:DUF4870 family protein [Sphingoaurantiacus capsulatus]|uniref:DUF4870 family protein n=1 Tax=Sphingoaurantiacus capsulatus TaxID=1771310 RepID=A0ABV7XF80_9SPHN
MSDQPSSGFDLNRPTIVSLLYLVGVLTALPTLLALILAYVWRDDAQAAWEPSHYRYHIRTFWLALLYGVIGVCTALIGVGFLILLVIPLWVLIRAIVSLAAAQRHSSLPNPGTWLW